MFCLRVIFSLSSVIIRHEFTEPNRIEQNDLQVYPSGKSFYLLIRSKSKTFVKYLPFQLIASRYESSDLTVLVYSYFQITKFEPSGEKTSNLGFDQVRHKLACTVTEDG